MQTLDSPPRTVSQAIQASQDYLLSQQNDQGYWWAVLESNVTMTAEVVLLHKIWGTDTTRPLGKMRRYITNQQRDNGSWELYFGDGGDLSTSIEAYMALRLLGVEKSDPILVRARQFILAQGGVTQARIFTKFHLALIGCFDWRGIPSIPPWIMLLPNELSPVTIYEMSSWARGSTVPLLIVFDRQPIWLVQPTITLDELYVGGYANARFELPTKGDWSDIFLWADQAFKVAETLDLVPFRREGIAAAEKWVLERQEATGDWGGIIPAMLNSLLALKAMDYDANDPIVARGLAAVDQFGVETDDEYWVQPCVSPVWDTALVMRGLIDSGLAPDHPAMVRGADWLIAQQILDYGDWAVKNRRGAPGAWAFEFDNRFYPDVDDTAVVVMALQAAKLPDETLKTQAIERAIKWVSTMQCKPGGWAAFDIDNDQEWLNDIPYGDLRAMIDPNTADVTARVLEMVAKFDAIGMDDTQIERALSYLMEEQEADGSWFGRWGVNYIYGTSGVLAALASIAPDRFRAQIKRGVNWLLSVQNTDGGWGETCESYKDVSLKGQGDSTASQTAWGVIGLLAAAEIDLVFDYGAIESAVQWLLKTQLAAGTWDEDWFTGTGFPQHFYLKYHLYQQHFPLTALGRYQRWQGSR
ncbi:squalene--hopene cyclase [filamentous cyanobacterium LEGE 11480]|uniref:Squalene--hopene cyclase n=1 Tax=Romeriopsis navalis LEGE 11480 TaxID=2777977 RepID=A0A928Z4E2_9CYAN|nr:squalene--hopene cyclase [Romeriopsis navalis]MBE9030228.1 squalene--hopene cyclase [Romeriopsis navalis LEGE 11480]